MPPTPRRREERANGTRCARAGSSGRCTDAAHANARSAVTLEPIITARQPTRGSDEVPDDRRERDADAARPPGAPPTRARDAPARPPRRASRDRWPTRRRRRARRARDRATKTRDVGARPHDERAERVEEDRRREHRRACRRDRRARPRRCRRSPTRRARRRASTPRSVGERCEIVRDRLLHEAEEDEIVEVERPAEEGEEVDAPDRGAGTGAIAAAVAAARRSLDARACRADARPRRARWRTATDALSDAIGPGIGSRARRVARALDGLFAAPLPSAPTTSADRASPDRPRRSSVSPAHVEADDGHAARAQRRRARGGSDVTRHERRVLDRARRRAERRRRQRRRAMLGPHDRGRADRRPRERMTAPKFCGSCTSSSATTSVASSTRDRVERLQRAAPARTRWRLGGGTPPRDAIELRRAPAARPAPRGRARTARAPRAAATARAPRSRRGRARAAPRARGSPRAPAAARR